MELLVVLLIIGILSTVALRTIDATRDRSLFDQTTKEMDKLVQAIVGNPDLTYDGRRVDFGFYGDMEELPESLEYLVQSSGDPAWRGPYLRLAAAGDTVSYLYDGWGTRYTYNPSLGTIHSDGNGKFPMTVKIADSLSQLNSNTISGTLTDRDDNAPDSTTASGCTLRLYYNNEALHSTPRVKVPSPGGFYEYSPTGADTVPIGIHKLVARVSGESLTRWVTVIPRSRTVVDFKFTKSFWNKLRMVGAAEPMTDSSGFRLYVVNDQPDDVTVSWLHFFQTPDSAYMRDFLIAGTRGTGFPLGPADLGIGDGDTVHFASVTIAPNGSQLVELLFQQFFPDSILAPPNDTLANVCGKEFQLRFSEGSEIKFTVPFLP